MPYLHFISTKLDSKSRQIEGLDFTFHMHSTSKIFDIVKYLKNEKTQKLKKKRERIGKMAQKDPKMKKGPNFFHAINPQNRTKKMSTA